MEYLLGNGKAIEWTKRPQDKARQMKAENSCSNDNKTRKISCNLKKTMNMICTKDPSEAHYLLQKNFLSNPEQTLRNHVGKKTLCIWTHGLNEDLNKTNMKSLGQKWQINQLQLQLKFWTLFSSNFRTLLSLCLCRSSSNFYRLAIIFPTYRNI